MKKSKLLSQYSRRLQSLQDPDDTGLDQELALLTRDEIADHEWSSDERNEIARLDAILATH